MRKLVLKVLLWLFKKVSQGTVVILCTEDENKGRVLSKYLKGRVDVLLHA